MQNFSQIDLVDNDKKTVKDATAHKYIVGIGETKNTKIV